MGVSSSLTKFAAATGALVAGFSLTGAANAAGTLVPNGDFSANGTSTTFYYTSGTQPQNWTVTNGSIDIDNVAAEPGAPATMVVDMDGWPAGHAGVPSSGPGTLQSAPITTTANTAYTLGFTLGNHFCSGEATTTKTLNVSVNGTQVGSYTVTDPSTTWTPEAIALTPAQAAGSVTITFQSTDPPASSCGAYIANVTLDPALATPLMNPLVVGGVAVTTVAIGIAMLRRRSS